MEPTLNDKTLMGAARRFMARVTQAAKPGNWALPMGGSAARIPGVVLNDWRQALEIPSFYRAIDLISSSMAVLPWGVVREDSKGVIEAQPDNSIHWLIHDAPNDEMNAFTWKKTIQVHAMGQGNGYAEIVRDRRGTPREMWLIDDPDRVTPGRNNAGRLVYRVRNPGGSYVDIPARDMYHIRGFSTDGVVGIGILEVARRNLQQNLGLERLLERYFQQGMRTPGFLKMKAGPAGFQSLQDMVKLIRKEYTGLNNFELPIPIDKDMEFTPAGATMQESQFVDLRKMKNTDVSRWTGVPPHMLYDLDKATFSNIENQSLEFVKYALLPRKVPMEQEANIKLLSNRHGGLRTELDMTALTLGDMAALGTFLKAMSDIGAFSPNDALRMLGRSTFKGGDTRTKQEQYKEVGSQRAPASAPAEEEDEPAPPPAPRDRRRTNGAAAPH